MLNIEQSYLLELIKKSFFDSTTIIPDDVNWENLFELARQQCIVPLIAPLVPLNYRKEWLEFSYQSKAHYMQLMYAQNSLVNLLKDKDISFVILKGTAAAIYYPNPSLRSFGDIDFYVPEDLLVLVRKLLEENDYIFVHSNERHIGYEKNGIEFELHSRFSCNSYNNIDYFVQRGVSHSVEYKICSNSFPGLPSDENGLVLLGHIMQHLKDWGIGLRQIIDWMMYVHNELDDLAWEEHFKHFAIEAGLEKLAITTTYMCKKWLGLPNDITWCNSAEDEVAYQLLIRVLDDGNFGRARAPSESVLNALKNEGTFKYLQHGGYLNWSLAQKYYIFRPFAWLYQLCSYAYKGIVGLLTGKKVFMKNRHNMSIDELLERLE